MALRLKIAVVVGSARKGSINQTYAEALEKLAGEGMVFDYLPVGELPLYNMDLEADMPTVLGDIKARIQAADGVLFVSPEHNRSVTALMKNTLDWCSRASGGNAWAGKRAAVCGASPGARGADLSQMHFRQIAVVLNLEILPQPEVYVHVKDGLFTEAGDFASERDASFQKRFLDRFADWVATA
ncbi:NAD(P)H-dependent oxidoreductase [Brevundimonas terrae]|uniref:NAD(P)H-dependent oxidoreductase n=1 Tax=Brevundimonas terrae TaxID=363631 RepID=A0ABN0YLR3_9CAUL|nr:NADPH-dependent FMN reductase [Brevundimonas terrae]NIJ28037.1 chromate reductase [Brevundimonas terrae]